jgi:putative hemolysin
MTDLAIDLSIIVALALANAFFSGAEIAILAVRKTRLRELADDGHRAARLALRLREDPERFLATVQVGITVVGASAGAFGGAVLEAPIAAVLRRAGFGTASDKVAFALVVAFVSVLSIVIGELVPKSLALRSSERVALWVSRPLFVMARVARPVIWFLTAASNALLRPFHDETTFTETRLSPDELQQLVEEATVAGSVDRETGEIASRALDLGRLKGFSVMIPRGGITWLKRTATREDAEKVLRERPHARYPVIDDERQPVGYVIAHELYAQLLDDRFDLLAVLREIPLFPESAAAVDILRALQTARSEIGLIVDENGSTSGLVSIETLAEELFGEIAGENEEVRPGFARQADGSFLVRGEMPVHEINRELDLELPVEQVASTLGGLVLAEYGGFPRVGTKLALPSNVDAEVMETSARRVLLVRLRLGRPRTSG